MVGNPRILCKWVAPVILQATGKDQSSSKTKDLSEKITEVSLKGVELQKTKCKANIICRRIQGLVASRVAGTHILKLLKHMPGSKLLRSFEPGLSRSFSQFGQCNKAAGGSKCTQDGQFRAFEGLPRAAPGSAATASQRSDNWRVELWNTAPSAQLKYLASYSSICTPFKELCHR